MDIKYLVATAGVISLLIGGQAWSQDNGDNDEGEATIRLMGNAEAELPEAVTKEITLPAAMGEESAALGEESAGVMNSADGLATANEARLRREEGLTTSDEARESTAELLEAAQENRENLGRSDDLPVPPDMPGVP